MRALNLLTLLLVIVGAINWLLVGAFDFNLVTALFGAETALSAIVYILIGLSGVYQIIPLIGAAQRPGRRSEVEAEAGKTPRAM
jgi:hypothetical protein